MQAIYVTVTERRVIDVLPEQEMISKRTVHRRAGTKYLLASVALAATATISFLMDGNMASLLGGAASLGTFQTGKRSIQNYQAAERLERIPTYRIVN